MMDVRLAARFLQAIPSGSRLLIVGDHHQLPSVGPGSVLRDLISAGLPCTILDRPRRHSGAIAHACWRIKEGQKTHPRLISDEESGGNANWTHLEIKSDYDILAMIVQIHRNYIAQYGREAAKANLQVISPEKKGTLGCYNLNAVLSPVVNPLPSAAEGRESFALSNGEDHEKSMRIGDRVVRTKNGTVKCLLDPKITHRELAATVGDTAARIMESAGWKSVAKSVMIGDRRYLVAGCYVVNGDMGEIMASKGNGPFRSTVVRFANPERLCMLPSGDAYLLLAYAMTVHKMQGSSMPICIIPLSSFYWNEKFNTGLFSRELVYTAFSRPSERLITVGRISELSAAIERKTIGRRMTRLREIMG
jgi:exodeoxyribonuclease V alpha subunit